MIEWHGISFETKKDDLKNPSLVLENSTKTISPNVYASEIESLDTEDDEQ